MRILCIWVWSCVLDFGLFIYLLLLFTIFNTIQQKRGGLTIFGGELIHEHNFRLREEDLNNIQLLRWQRGHKHYRALLLLLLGTLYILHVI